MMREVGHQPLQPLLVPAGVPLWAEEHGALIVIRAVDQKTVLVKMEGYLGANETRGPCDQNCFCGTHDECIIKLNMKDTAWSVFSVATSRHF